MADFDEMSYLGFREHTLTFYEGNMKSNDTDDVTRSIVDDLPRKTKTRDIILTSISNNEIDWLKRKKTEGESILIFCKMEDDVLQNGG